MSRPCQFLLPFLIVPIIFTHSFKLWGQEFSTTVEELRTRAAERVYWPTQEWRWAAEPQRQTRMQTSACQGFHNYMTQNQQEKEGLKTHSLLVAKQGLLEYEFYDDLLEPETPQCLWSASKTVSVGLLGVAVQKGDLDLSQSVADFFPEANGNGKYAYLFSKMTLRDLIEMGAGIDWHEVYDENIQASDVLRMLYTGLGVENMARFYLDSPMLPYGPGNKWVYSGGNSNVIMKILRRVYGASQYQSWPWKNFFDRIGMKSVIFEKDQADNFVGSSYVHTNVRDMARFGFLYLNDGIWDGERILPENWVTLARSVSPPVLSEHTDPAYVEHEGVFGATMWLNQNPLNFESLPFPNSPQEVFFAAGHYGQLIMVFPKEDIVVTRTAWDKEYWSKIDNIMTTILDCFAYNPEMGEPANPYKQPSVNDLLAKDTAGTANAKRAVELSKTLGDVAYALESGVLQTLVAKEMCSCYYVTGFDRSSCVERSNLDSKIEWLVDIHINNNQVVVTPKPLGALASVLGRLWNPGSLSAVTATWNAQEPQFGCSVTEVRPTNILTYDYDFIGEAGN